MRKPLAYMLVLALVGALLAGGAALAAKPTVVRAGNLVLTLNGSVSPKALPKNEMAPITLNASGNISTVDGSQPPVTQEVSIDFDRSGTVNAKGLPVCKRGKLEARTTSAAKAACPTAIVGSGKTTVRVAFPEQAPFTSTGPLVLFNGGVSGGTTTMYIHAYVNVPAPTAIVTTVKITKINKGRYGMRAVAKIPTIAGGSGAVTDFSFTVQRKFKRGGTSQSYLLARCATGSLAAHATVIFKGGTRIAGTVVRTCTVRG